MLIRDSVNDQDVYEVLVNRDVNHGGTHLQWDMS
jgi:hypothetical protein